MKPENIEKVRFWIGSKWPAWMYKVAVFFRVLYKRLRMPEVKKSFGELNPDKTFYVIRLFPPAAGFLANYNYVLGYMKYAFDKGWIPVIDMENYATLYQEIHPVNGTRNVWEYFFEQPYDKRTKKRYSLDEVYKSKNVVLGMADNQDMFNNSMEENTIKWQHEMSLLIPFNKFMLNKALKAEKSFFPECGSVLGVSIRGSDTKKRLVGHPIPLPIDEMISIVKRRYSEWSMEKIFVKAEEKETIDALKGEFANLYYTECNRIENNASRESNVALAYQSKSEALSEYLTDIYLLSKCNSIIGTMNNGISSAIIWNGGKFDNVEILDNGVWK